MTVDPENRAGLSALTLEHIEQCCSDFERQWKSGRAPCIQQALSQATSKVDREVLLSELLLLDVDYRFKRGADTSPQGYLDSFPEHSDLVNRVLNNNDLQSQETSFADATVRISRGRIRQTNFPERIGRYRILEMLGSGGFATVCRAWDEELNRDVAVKIPHIDSVLPDGHADLFLKEAQTLATLSHPSIAAVYDVGRLPDGRCYMLTQFVEGGDLAQRIKTEKLPLLQALEIVIEVAEALDYAHDRGFVHRDVKPSNILLDSKGKPWLVDFGLALGEADVGRPAMEFAGSPDYMSPEQIRGEGHLVDGRADIYSLGVVLYQLATGQKPFVADDLNELAELIQNSRPELLRTFDDSIPLQVQQACLTALEKLPGDRYATAIDFAEDLRRFVEPPAKSSTHSGSRRSLTIGLLAASVFLLAQFIWSWADGGDNTAIGPNPKTRIESIAVLPFNSLQLNPDDQYLGLSLADAVITKLSNTGKLNVRPTGSVKNMLNRTSDPVEAGKMLKVDVVVDSSVQRAGDLTRATVRIVRTADGETIWAGTFEEGSKDTFALQDSIVERIANAIALELDDDQDSQRPPKHIPNPLAYDAYLKGRYYWHQRASHYKLRNTIQFFEKSIELDPKFALAHVGLAECYALLDYYSFTEVDGVMELTRAAANEALRLDPELPDAWRALAFVEFSYGWDWQRAEELYKLAIQLNPHDATARQWYGEMLMYQQRSDEAIVQMEWAARLNPLSEIIYSIQGSPYLYADDIDSARITFDRALEFFPSSVIALFGIAFCNEVEGDYEQALKIFRPHYSRKARSKAATIGVACCLANTGQEAKARALYNELINLPDGNRFTPYGLAAICAALGDTDLAFEWLDQALSQHDDLMVMLAVDHRFDSLSADPRFKELLRKMKF